MHSQAASLGRRLARVALLASALLASTLLPARTAGAQYFGRNKVQYERFDWRILRSAHFDSHFYPAESVHVADAARMAERWYARHSYTLGQTFDRRSLIFYADHPDFEQTNLIGGFVDQGTGGVTEPARSRVIMPFTGVYADDDHVLGHEMVHVFQFDIAQSGKNAAGLRGMENLPLWLIEGMAEYLSLGRNDALTAMWLRDAARRNDLPSIRQLTTDSRYFPYRYGQALWAYIGGRWGDTIVTQLYRASLRRGFEPAIRSVLGVSADTLSAQWLRAIRTAYLPLMEGRTVPREVGQNVLPRSGRNGDMDLAPALSPDGRYVAFFTRRGVFSIDLYIADVNTGKIVKKLTGPNTDSHFDALSFITSSGSWSPDGRKLAFVVFANGDNQIAIFDVGSRRIERQVRVRGVGQINDPAWGPDDQIVFSGSAGGISDLYLLDLRSERVRQLTNDKDADLQPSWSPDGRTIAFASDRGTGTDFSALTYAPVHLALMDVSSGSVRSVDVVPGARQINPQWSADGRSLYFVSDRGGFQDLYRTEIGEGGGTGAVFQVTRVATGVSGITALSPSLSIARQSGRLVFSVFDKAGYSLRRLDPEQAMGEPIQPLAPGAEIAIALPPAQPYGRALVQLALTDPATGLPRADSALVQRPYRPRYGLDYLGSPGVGFAAGGGRFGLYGSVVGYFTDQLSDRVIAATVAVNGQATKDAGGEVVYYNQKRRWNWALGASHIPYRTGYATVYDTTVTTNQGQVNSQAIAQVLQRIYVDQAQAQLAYPFSMTRRVEFSAAATHLGYDTEIYRLLTVGNQVIDESRRGGPSYPGISYGQVSGAFVGDYSYFGFTSPIAGGRWRFEYTPTVGQLVFQQALADYRRYLFIRPVTLAVRGLHVARYGRDADDQRLTPLFLGEEQLVRGYSIGSFDPTECSAASSSSITGCPELDRLVGSRIGVASAELRIPLFGTREFGLLNLPFLPTELSPFVDAGVAWNSTESPNFEFRREAAGRIPVVSAGVAIRVNLLGYAVGEAYYAYPFQRPEKGAHFGFQLAPGW